MSSGYFTDMLESYRLHIVLVSKFDDKNSQHTKKVEVILHLILVTVFFKAIDNSVQTGPRRLVEIRRPHPCFLDILRIAQNVLKL